MISVPETPSNWDEQARFNQEVADCLQAQQESLQALYDVLAEHDVSLNHKIIVGPMNEN